MDYSYLQQKLAESLRSKGITNEAVLHAMAKTPRHLFVSDKMQSLAYEDTPLPIDCQQTISQPYVVAKMTEVILGGKSRLKNVLEIGTGSGYQAAILAQVADKVFTIERIQTLLNQAISRFSLLKIKNIYPKHGDGHLGWPEHSPFDGIIVTASTPEIPQALLNQLANDGRLIIPVGDFMRGQNLQLIIRHENEYEKHLLDAVVFVPLLSGIQQ